MRVTKDIPIVSFKFRQKQDPFLRLHSEEPLEGDSLVIFGLEMQTSKDAAPESGHSEYVYNSLNSVTHILETFHHY